MLDEPLRHCFHCSSLISLAARTPNVWLAFPAVASFWMAAVSAEPLQVTSFS
ncbi:MAG TPA: hypothetical protein VGH27_30220 [Streptosporangiaceae bacterium]|jgi:hypothetical protein